jgi:hypothetical protein
MLTFDILQDESLFSDYFVNTITTLGINEEGNSFHLIINKETFEKRTEIFRQGLINHKKVILMRIGVKYRINYKPWFVTSCYICSILDLFDKCNIPLIYNTYIPPTPSTHTDIYPTHDTYLAKFSYHKYLLLIKKKIPNYLTYDISSPSIHILCNDNVTVSFHKTFLLEYSDYFKILNNNQSQDANILDENLHVESKRFDSRIFKSFKLHLYQIDQSSEECVSLIELYEFMDYHQFNINLCISLIQYYPRSYLLSFITETKTLEKTPFLKQFSFFVKSLL